MRIRLLDLDNGVARQPRLRRLADDVSSLRSWGPNLRLACGWRSFAKFQSDLTDSLHQTTDREPAITFVGSGDFHHVSLALLRRQTQRCNLLVLDNHPDWMRSVPFLHCGTWLYHAAQLPQVARIFHVGGEVDFDNSYRLLAPWSMLRSGKIVVLPAIRQFRGGGWSWRHATLREAPDETLTAERIADLLAPYRLELARLPLYVSLDRDVMRADQAVVNWDSGHLMAWEVMALVKAFVSASGSLASMDVVGDWSAVEVSGALRRVMHWTQHPTLHVDAAEAQRCNEELNLKLIDTLRAVVGGRARARLAA